MSRYPQQQQQQPFAQSPLAGRAILPQQHSYGQPGPSSHHRPGPSSGRHANPLYRQIEKDNTEREYEARAASWTAVDRR